MQKCLASRNKAPATKIVFQILVADALFLKIYFCSRRLFSFKCCKRMNVQTLFYFPKKQTAVILFEKPLSCFAFDLLFIQLFLVKGFFVDSKNEV